MDIKERVVGQVSVLDLTGKFSVGSAGSSLTGAVDGVLSQGLKHVILNLQELTFIDSSGLGELITVHRTVKEIGGNVILINASAQVKNLLGITRLLTVMQVLESEEDALKKIGVI